MSLSNEPGTAGWVWPTHIPESLVEYTAWDSILYEVDADFVEKYPDYDIEPVWNSMPSLDRIRQDLDTEQANRAKYILGSIEISKKEGKYGEQPFTI